MIFKKGSEIVAIPLSPETRRKLKRVFREEDQGDAKRLLVNECADNLPLAGNTDEFKSERIRFAVMRLSKGNIEDLKNQIHAAQQDWRDVLLAAGFANNVDEHKRWNP